MCYSLNIFLFCFYLVGFFRWQCCCCWCMKRWITNQWNEWKICEGECMCVAVDAVDNNYWTSKRTKWVHGNGFTEITVVAFSVVVARLAWAEWKCEIRKSFTNERQKKNLKLKTYSIYTTDKCKQFRHRMSWVLRSGETVSGKSLQQVYNYKIIENQKQAVLSSV